MDHKHSKLAASIILAGGQGTRLFPLTQTRCKPDVCFGGRYRLVNIPISNSINSGIEQIFVISQFFSSQLNFHISQTFSLNPLLGQSIHFLYPEETAQGKTWYEGTADAVRKNLPLFENLPHEYLIILSGDQLYSMDLLDMLQFTIENEADLCIAALPVCEKDATRMGLLKVNQHHVIQDFFEKPKEKTILDQYCLSSSSNERSFLASMGIYIFKKSTLVNLLKTHAGLDFGKDIIPYQIQQGKKSIAYRYQGYWEDIGTVESFYHANLALINGNLALDLYDDQKPIFSQPNHFPSARIENTQVSSSIICEGSIIESSKVIKSMIGPRVRIGKECTIEQTIMLGNPISDQLTPWAIKSKTIGDHCFLKGVILDEYVQIGNHVRLSNEKNIERYDGDGIFIRDKIIVVASGKKIPDGFQFNPE
jgi:glucose-1-phosphate adenylyltransferase